MLNNAEYIRNSLELHLFFSRIMKEHSFFLAAGFMEKNQNYKHVANEFQIMFSKILNKAINLANGNVSKEVLLSNEIVTNNTMEAEKISSNLTGVAIDESLTLKELKLTSGANYTEELLREVNKLNSETIILVKNLINFKEEVLKEVLDCKLFTANYPLLITHITNEAKMYLELLLKLERKEEMSGEFILNQELFWNNIMKEHAEFIRGLLDPSEMDLILTADKYAVEYEQILEDYKKKSTDLTLKSLEETEQFKKFKIAGEEGLLSCKIKSIIVPLLADHVLREANHFIRLLKSFK